MPILVASLLFAAVASAAPAPLYAGNANLLKVRDAFTNHPYTGPKVPVGDWVDQTVNGNGKGFARLNEPPAVWPSDLNPTNNINTISLAYTPTGINIHFSTPFGIGGDPSVKWGTDQYNLNTNAKGSTSS